MTGAHTQSSFPPACASHADRRRRESSGCYPDLLRSYLLGTKLRAFERCERIDILQPSTFSLNTLHVILSKFSDTEAPYVFPHVFTVFYYIRDVSTIDEEDSWSVFVSEQPERLKEDRFNPH